MISKNRRLVIILIGSFLAQLVQVGAFSLFLAQKLDGLNVPLSTIGWFVGIQWFTVLLVAPVIPRMGNYLGLNNLNQISGLITLAGLLVAYTDNQLLLGLAGILLGAGLIIRWIACDTLVVQLSEATFVGRSIGLHEALMGFGIAMGPIFFIFLDLQYVLHSMVIITVSSIAAFNLSRVKLNYREEGKNTPVRSQDFLLLKVALVAALVGGFIETATAALFPFYFSADGFSLQESAWFISAFGLGGTLLQLPLGFLSDKIGYRLAQLFACVVAILGIAALFLSMSSFMFIYITLFVFGGAIGAFNTLAVIQVGSDMKPEKTASAMSFVAVFYTFGAIIGPIITANILDRLSTQTVLIAYAFVVIMVAVVICSELMRSRSAAKM